MKGIKDNRFITQENVFNKVREKLFSKYLVFCNMFQTNLIQKINIFTI